MKPRVRQVFIKGFSRDGVWRNGGSPCLGGKSIPGNAPVSGQVAIALLAKERAVSQKAVDTFGHGQLPRTPNGLSRTKAGGSDEGLAFQAESRAIVEYSLEVSPRKKRALDWQHLATNR